jgi:hypothetical protein
LHQPEELKPVLTIILAYNEAESLMQMMNKQVAAFVFYFLKDAAFPEMFLFEFLCKTCNATLVAEIQECEWDTDTQTITTMCKKKQHGGRDDSILSVIQAK